MHTKMLVRTQNCLLVHFVVIKRQRERVDQHEMHFTIIRTCEVAALLDSNMLRCEDNSRSMSYQQKASQDSELLTRSLCCHQKATGIVLIITRHFS